MENKINTLINNFGRFAETASKIRLNKMKYEIYNFHILFMDESGIIYYDYMVYD